MEKRELKIEKIIFTNKRINKLINDPERYAYS